MKIEGQRVVGKDIIEGSKKTQTRAVAFSTDAEDADLFGARLSEIPKKKSAIEGEPDYRTCKAVLTLDMKAESIKLESLEFGVDVYGENPCAESDRQMIGHWLPMKKAGFRKYEIDEEAIPESYPKNDFIDGLKKALFKSARI